MFQFLFATSLFLLISTTTQAGSPDFCRNSVRPGENMDTRFFGLEYAMLGHALAEKYCGAKPVSMERKFLGFLERQGCSPETEIHQDVAISVSQLETASLISMAADCNPSSSISEKDAKVWAKNATEQLGGCEFLLELHASELEARQ